MRKSSKTFELKPDQWLQPHGDGRAFFIMEKQDREVVTREGLLDRLSLLLINDDISKQFFAAITLLSKDTARLVPYCPRQLISS